MPKISIFSSLSNVQMLLHTLLRGRRVGRDALGNTYYRGRPRPDTHGNGVGRERRWVIYKGAADASSVPPEWHGWLHHQTDTVPQDQSRYRKPWQIAPQRNLTGTNDAYLPPKLKTGTRDHATGDYTPWQPPRE
jgi:NADH:ubiquinone oxidoreductase subunit